MRRALLISIVFLALIAGASPAAAQYHWTGWYVGANAGGAWSDSDVATSTVSTSAPTYFPPVEVASIKSNGKGRLHSSGFTGGAQGGYNWQAGSLVLGLEADFEYLRQDATRKVGPIIYPPGGGSAYRITQRLKTDYVFTLRPRVGWAADNSLFYVTSGLAVGSVNTRFNFTDNFLTGAKASGSKTSIEPGWTVGGGMEFGLTPNWTLRGEYLYVNMSTTTAHSSNLFYPGVFNPAPFRHRSDLELHIVRAAFNFKF